MADITQPIVLNQQSWWQRNIIWLFIGFAMIFFFITRNGCSKHLFDGTLGGGRDTLSVKTNTVYVPQPPVYVPITTGVQSGITSYPVYLPSNAQGQIPAGTIEALTEQVKTLSTNLEQLGKDYYATKKYNESIDLKDSTGVKVGTFQYGDVVSQNSIQTRAPNYQLSFPHTTTTITVTDPRNQVYIGGGLTGNSVPPFVNGGSVALALKNKKDRIYGISAGAQKYNNLLVPQFGISYLTKIRLGKK